MDSSHSEDDLDDPNATLVGVLSDNSDNDYVDAADINPPTMSKVIEFKNAARAYKGHLTRAHRTLSATIKELGDPASVRSFNASQQIRGYISKIESLRDKVDSTYASLISLEPAKRAEYENETATLDAIYDPEVAKAIAFLGQLPADADPVPDGGGRALRTASSAVKPNMALKPECLSLDNLPPELILWIDRFLAFWRTSNLGLLDYTDQQSYLMAYFDNTLKATMKHKFNPNMPIFGPNSCMEELQAVFRARYPIFNRREQFFDSTFDGPIRDLPSYLARLESLAEVAEIGDLSRDSLIAHKALSSIRDKELRRLAAREEALTLPRLKALVIQRVRENENLHKNASSLEIQAVQGSNVVCYDCKGVGHIAADCRRRRNDSQGAHQNQKPRRYNNRWQRGRQRRPGQQQQQQQAKPVNQVAEEKEEENPRDDIASDSQDEQEHGNDKNASAYLISRA